MLMNKDDLLSQNCLNPSGLLPLCLLGKPSKQRVGGYTGYTYTCPFSLCDCQKYPSEANSECGLLSAHAGRAPSQNYGRLGARQSVHTARGKSLGEAKNQREET